MHTETMKKVCLYTGAVVALFFFTEYTVAATSGAGNLGTVAENVTTSLTNVAKLIAAASYVAGIGFALAGMVKFKAHRDNLQQVPLSAPLVLIAVAAGLVFLPSVIESAGSTVFGSSAQSAGAKGSGLDLGE